ncbi:MAG: hypothetical protein IGS48_22130 [Oscillatoriales cyanobacterium C42_A2020_001]|nr:hypothetical protein [Leptolyngbyaceae cyanobacterium C42_A2020_001]
MSNFVATPSGSKLLISLWVEFCRLIPICQKPIASQWFQFLIADTAMMKLKSLLLALLAAIALWLFPPMPAHAASNQAMNLPAVLSAPEPKVEIGGVRQTQS